MKDIANSKSSSLSGVVAAALLLVSTAIPAADAPTPGLVRVAYSNPERFTDVGDNGRVTADARRDALLAQLKRHIEDRAAPLIPPGGVLSLSITDIDMAGSFEWWRGPRADHVRIVKDVYPPRIKLEFRLVDAGGGVVADGRRELTDLSFMTNVEYRNDLLRYEKKLIDDWLEREFTGPKLQRADSR